jgi:hypothetical protein
MNIFIGRITQKALTSKDLTDGTTMLVKGYSLDNTRLRWEVLGYDASGGFTLGQPNSPPSGEPLDRVSNLAFILGIVGIVVAAIGLVLAFIACCRKHHHHRYQQVNH